MKFRPNWGTHIPALIEVLNKSHGPVLELGMGISSTPLLHAMCADQNRHLVSYDDNPTFINLFKRFKNSNHEIELVEDWDKVPLELCKGEHWGMVLVDHHPDERRYREIERLAHTADYLVVHDTEPANDDIYQYSKVYNLFKYKTVYGKFNPCTTVLSNKYEH